MGAVMLAFILLECLIVATSADHVDSGQYFRKISVENDVIADNAVLLNEDFFKCQRSQPCVVSQRGVRNKEKWAKVPNNEPVYRNLARGMITAKSSNPASSGKVVDGDRRGDTGNLCSTTKHGAGQWWMVDFGARAYIESVSISPLTSNCCLDRLQNFDIKIGDTRNKTANNICRKNAKVTVKKTKSFMCDKPLVGRYLYIVNNANNRLSLCEVEAYGTYV